MECIRVSLIVVEASVNYVRRDIGRICSSARLGPGSDENEIKKFTLPRTFVIMRTVFAFTSYVVGMLGQQQLHSEKKHEKLKQFSAQQREPQAS